jgi:hypothetical protein
MPPPPDIENEIGKFDPLAAVEQIIDLHLAIRDVEQRRLPQHVWDAAKKLGDDFVQNRTNHVVLRAFVPDCARNPGRAHVLVARTEAWRRATQLLYALHCDHARTGHWPAKLSDLRSMPRLCRTDPFSGKDFVYHVTIDGPLLYSVGMNGKDDGGKHDPHWGEKTDGDYVFWPVQHGDAN